MARRLPPLNQIRAFEAAARHQSFLKAGEELHVTHSAISHQIKALEETLGKKLFHRNARGVELTADAKPLFEDAARALDLLAKGVENFLELEAQQDLKVSVAPSFA